MKNWISRISVFAGLLFAFGPASADPVAPVYSDCATEFAQSVDGTVDCVSIDGTKFNDEGNKWWINDISNSDSFDPLFGGTEEWIELPVWADVDSVMFVANSDWDLVDEGETLTAGYFGILASVFDMYDEVMLFFKDGQTHGGFILDPTGYSDVGGVITDFYGLGGLVLTDCNKGGVVGPCYLGDFDNPIPSGQAISHLNLWVRGGAQQVSEPGTLAMLGFGLIGMGLMRRRKIV